MSLLLILFGCEKSEKDFIDTDSSIYEETLHDDTADSYNDPWPDDEVSWDNVLSVVFDGDIVSSGDILSFTSPPAGIDATIIIRFTLTNRSNQELTFDPDPSAWLVAEGYTWVSDPPTELYSQQSIGVEFSFNPVFATEAMVVPTIMTIPILDDEYSLSLEVTIPRPLRMVLVGDDGYTLISDNYGADFFYEQLPQDNGQNMITATWGNGLFIRGSRFGDWNADGYYEYSEDGIAWQESFVGSGAFPFDCAYGLGEYLCVRGYGAYLTHSSNGSVFLHEAEAAGIPTFITDLLFTGEHFVGVGRDGHRTIATGILSFDVNTILSDTDLGDFNDIAQGDGLIVAVGGTDQHAISTSADGGYTWIDQSLYQSSNARINSIAFKEGTWVVRASNRVMYISYDGYDWEPINTSTGAYELLGSHGGWFIGYTQQWDDSPPGIYRSQDGETWEEVHLFPEGIYAVTMATEQWSGQ